MHIIIPMAGNGQRFVDAGYDLPKPMIDVCGKPMIERIIENLNIDGKYHFIVKKEHIEKYDIDQLLKSKLPDCEIISVSEKTEGAACSAMLAFQNKINENEELVVTNCDQIFEWDSQEFFREAQNVDGALLCHIDEDPKWSYCHGYKMSPTKLLVTNVVEKPKIAPIDNFANVGFYYWNKARFFTETVATMIEKEERVNGEFYIAPSYNHMLNGFNSRTSSGVVIAKLCKKMHGLGTPDDLEKYINLKKS